jgi:cytoskeletal protein CcmA (bactofilin family)
MLGRSNNRQQAASLSQEIATAHTANTGPLLTIVGASAKLEGKFEITDSIQIECEVGGELSVGRVTGNIETDSLVISKGGFFNGNVIKSKGADAVAPLPVHLVDGARAATTQR